MLRIEGIINEIKAVDSIKDGAWIFENGTIKEDVFVGDVIPLLEELKEYEVNATDNAIEKLLDSNDRHWNTYNWNANISHDLDVFEKEINGSLYMGIMVHRLGDVRGNYTDRFLVKFDDEYEFFELESLTQPKYIDNRYVADINLMQETFNVYDVDMCDDVGDFWMIEKADLLDAINETVNK